MPKKRIEQSIDSTSNELTTIFCYEPIIDASQSDYLFFRFNLNHIKTKKFSSDTSHSHTFCCKQVVKRLQTEYFDLILPCRFIKKMELDYPIEVAAFKRALVFSEQEKIKKRSFEATIEMEKVIRQIEESASKECCLSIYLDAKIQELLALQLQQYYNTGTTCHGCFLKHEEQIHQARCLLEQEYMNPPSIAELARQVGTNATVLKKGFRHLYKETIYGYLFEYRMNIAHKLIVDSHIPIAEIAEKSGYAYQSHFTTAFKRKFGLTPSQFRQKLS